MSLKCVLNHQCYINGCWTAYNIIIIYIVYRVCVLISLTGANRFWGHQLVGVDQATECSPLNQDFEQVETHLYV